jgi:hypothetical protein
MNGQSRDNGSTEYTRHRTNKCQRKPKNQSGMDNPETMVALGTQGTGQISVRENDGLIRNRHSRDNGSTGYTRHRTHKRQGKPKDQSGMNNPETMAALGTQDTGQISVRENRRTNQEWTIQRQ